MNQPTPAIVAQSAVRRLPRWALWLFCLAYVLPGFIGRGPWKREDVAAFGYMAELAGAASDWWHPTLGGLAPEFDALLPYWLGAWAIRLAPDWITPDLAVRLPYIVLLVITLLATWYATYSLARSPLAQPVNFAFGGEAEPTDYARTIADAGVLALIACLGLAQISHETTPALAQLCFTALLFYGVAGLPRKNFQPVLACALGLIGLTLSGAPSMAIALGAGCAVIYLLRARLAPSQDAPRRWQLVLLIGLVAISAVMATQLNLWRWRIDLPLAQVSEWQSLGRLFLWFTWPAWPLALWTLWRWRHQWLHLHFAGRHVWLPLWFALVASVATLTTNAADRSLLLALPALAALAAFALPTLKRSVAALIDWFTLIFFSGCALIIWVVWISLQTGLPAQPARNVARLAPGFLHSFSITSFVIALSATLTWVWLVKWRAGRHRAALWKSLVLPAGGAALCWLLLMTLWLPLLDYARSYAPMVRQAKALLPAQVSCVATLGLSRSQWAALRFFGDLPLKSAESGANCRWLIADGENPSVTAGFRPGQPWRLSAVFSHPANLQEKFLLFERLEK
ncbi:MAG: hypothetical protein PHH58_08760 [Rhodoferax sp.]|nr:hypothetical protein [Rhodoferax sp.]